MTGSFPIALAAGVGAAACFGVATAVQHLEAGRAAPRRSLDPRLLGQLVRRRLWLLSFVAEFAAIGLQTLALRFGSVALVQALIVAGLPAAVMLSALFGARRIGIREISGLALCSTGVAAVALVQPATSVTANIPAAAPALLAGAVTVLVVAGLLRSGRMGHWSRAAATGAAAGVAIGAGSMLLAVCAASIDRPERLLASWPPYVLVAVGLVGLVLAQSAFQTGALGPPLASLTLLEPVTAVVLAAAVLHQRLPTGRVDVVVACTGAVLATLGVLLLASPAQRLERYGRSQPGG